MGAGHQNHARVAAAARAHPSVWLPARPVLRQPPLHPGPFELVSDVWTQSKYLTKFGTQSASKYLTKFGTLSAPPDLGAIDPSEIMYAFPQRFRSLIAMSDIE